MSRDSLRVWLNPPIWHVTPHLWYSSNLRSGRGGGGGRLFDLTYNFTIHSDENRLHSCIINNSQNGEFLRNMINLGSCRNVADHKVSMHSLLSNKLKELLLASSICFCTYLWVQRERLDLFTIPYRSTDSNCISNTSRLAKKCLDGWSVRN